MNPRETATERAPSTSGSHCFLQKSTWRAERKSRKKRWCGNFTRRVFSALSVVRKFYGGRGGGLRCTLCETMAVNFRAAVKHAGDTRVRRRIIHSRGAPARGLIERLWDELIIDFVERDCGTGEIYRDPTCRGQAFAENATYNSIYARPNTVDFVDSLLTRSSFNKSAGTGPSERLGWEI